MDERIEKIEEAAKYINSRLNGIHPFAGIVLGSGLGKLADKIEDPIVISESASKRFATPLIEKVEIKINDNDIFRKNKSWPI